MTTDNPAGRLYSILEACKQKQSSLQARDVWYEILDVSNKNDALLMSRLGKVMELPQQIISDMKIYFPRQKNSHIHWSNAVNKAFSEMNLNSQWYTFITHIDAHTMTYLNMSVDMLDTKENIKIVSDDDLKKIRNKVDKVLQDIINLEIDAAFKKDIIKYLRKILIAIDEYRITGIVPIMETVEATLGHAFIDENYKNNLQNTDIGNLVISTLSTVADIFTVYQGLPSISLMAGQLLSK